jgi:hypothetical protein
MLLEEATTVYDELSTALDKVASAYELSDEKAAVKSGRSPRCPNGFAVDGGHSHRRSYRVASNPPGAERLWPAGPSM